MEKDLEKRPKRFALAVIKCSSSLPRTREIDILIRPVIRSATSIGANCEEANRGLSRADFANKIETVQKGSSFSSTSVSLMIKAHKNCCRNHQSCSRFSRASGKS